MGTTTGRLIPTPQGRVPHVAPRALETEEVAGIVADFKTVTANAIAAGFDGVELHCANGYLLEQFLYDGINDRTDRNSGSVENCARIVFEALDAMLEVIDSSRLGIRFSPHSLSFRQCDSNPVTTYQHVLQKLSSYGLAYVHLIEPRGFFLHETRRSRPSRTGKRTWSPFGRYFISNPDLVKRLRLDASLSSYKPNTFYLPGAAGYTDQTFLEDTQESAGVSFS
ncbi:hypothetical protein PRNP1_010553 [Phytophthora ramorum]